MFYYGMITSVMVLYLFMMAIINHHQELHTLPPFENCMRSEIHASPAKIFLYFTLPIFIAFIVTLFFDSNIWQMPYSTHVNLKDIYSAIFAQTLGQIDYALKNIRCFFSTTKKSNEQPFHFSSILYRLVSP